ncbi:MAG: FtsX-like permease family protein [Clostridiaceae bacterium]
MGSAFIKNLIRDIQKTISRFLSIVVIIAIGVSFYAGVRAASPDMKLSGDYYFSRNNLMDFKLVSNLGLTKNDLDEFKKVISVTAAEGSYSVDAITVLDEASLVLNINSLPVENGINQVRLIQGREPKKDNEAIIEDSFFTEHSLKLGDKISLASGTDTSIKSDLKNDVFTVVGTAESPLYVSEQRMLSSVGNGSVKGFMYVLPDVFKYDVYSEIYLRCKSGISENSLTQSDEYKNEMETIENSLEQLGEKRAQMRYDYLVDNGSIQVNNADSSLTASKRNSTNQFAKAEAEINSQKQKLAAQEAALASSGNLSGTALSKINAAKLEIARSEEQLYIEKKSAEAQISEAEIGVKSGKVKLSEIKEPEFYALGRSDNVGYESYRQDSYRIDKIGMAFPFIFFLVAALVSLTTMTRMVQEKRIEIGTFKALGYSRFAIVSHYLIYSFAASLAGSVLGLSIGFRLFPPLILNAYGSLYTIPDKLYPFNTVLAAQGFVIAVFFTVIAAVAATMGELREVPASLMRPKAPKAGRTIFLEKIPFLWERLSFTKKITARNIFRYKQRFFMTAIGIAACTGLMITGFALKGSISGSSENQFNKIYKYDMLVRMESALDKSEKKSVEDQVFKDANIKSTLFAYMKNGTVKKNISGSEDAYVVVPERKDQLRNYIYLTTGKEDLNLTDDGVILTKKFADLIGKNVGDTFSMTLDDMTMEVRVAGITEHYIQHYIYLSPDYYKKLTGKELKLNSFYGLLANTTEKAEDSTAKALTDISEVNSVSFKSNVFVDFGKTMKSMNAVILVLIVSAGVLAFVVIFNLTNININERRRELATIKLLGFFNPELAAYIYRENVILTIIGSITGIGLGILIANFVMNTAETNIMMFYRGINPVYYLYSVVLTMLFSAVVNLAMYSKFDKIDMIESLKSAE